MRDNNAGLEGQILIALRKLVSLVSEGADTLDGLTVEVKVIPLFCTAHPYCA